MTDETDTFDTFEIEGHAYGLAHERLLNRAMAYNGPCIPVDVVMCATASVRRRISVKVVVDMVKRGCFDVLDHDGSKIDPTNENLDAFAAEVGLGHGFVGLTQKGVDVYDLLSIRDAILFTWVVNVNDGVMSSVRGTRSARKKVVAQMKEATWYGCVGESAWKKMGTKERTAFVERVLRDDEIVTEGTDGRSYWADPRSGVRLARRRNSRRRP